MRAHGEAWNAVRQRTRCDPCAYSNAGANVDCEANVVRVCCEEVVCQCNERCCKGNCGNPIRKVGICAGVHTTHRRACVCSCMISWAHTHSHRRTNAYPNASAYTPQIYVHAQALICAHTHMNALMHKHRSCWGCTTRSSIPRRWASCTAATQ